MITDLEKWDSIASGMSSDDQVVTVSADPASGRITLTAGKKTGTAKVTVMLASQIPIEIKVSVKKSKRELEQVSGSFLFVGKMTFWVFF